MNLSQYSDDLRTICKFIDTHPALADATWYLGSDTDRPRIYTFAYTLYDIRKLVTGAGKWTKETTKTDVQLVQRFALHDVWQVQIITPHETAACRKVPTGKKVTRRVPTAYETIEEDEYTWECPDSVLR